MSDPKTSEPPKRHWNAMVYLAGENNLAEECIYALKELKRAAPRPETVTEGKERTVIDERAKVVAQLDASGLGGNELFYDLSRGGEDGELANDKKLTIDTSETSYRGVLKDFISTSIMHDWSPVEGRAEQFLLILSGHGNGVISDFLSRDIESPDDLSIPKLQWVFEEVREDLAEKLGRDHGDFKIDVLGLDSCMMSMAEIGYELRDYARFMVAAEGFEPNTGWPYERIISEILSVPSIEPKELASLIVKKYIDYYSDFLPAGRSVDQAACDLSKCEALAEAMKTLSVALIKGLSDPEWLRQIVLAHWEAQSYKEDQYVDLYDFCNLLDTEQPEQPDQPEPPYPTGSVVMNSVVMKKTEVHHEIVEACKAVKKVLRDGDQPMILKSCYSGPAVQYSYGLSVYFPWSQVIESYKDLEFAEDTKWRDFLVEYVRKTRRLKRRCPSAKDEEIFTAELFFDPTMSGFNFIQANNKDVPQMNRVMSNKVGTMKNPAIDYVNCKCELAKETPGDKPGNSATWPDGEDPNAGLE